MESRQRERERANKTGDGWAGCVLWAPYIHSRASLSDSQSCLGSLCFPLIPFLEDSFSALAALSLLEMFTMFSYERGDREDRGTIGALYSYRHAYMYENTIKPKSRTENQEPDRLGWNLSRAVSYPSSAADGTIWPRLNSIPTKAWQKLPPFFFFLFLCMYIYLYECVSTQILYAHKRRSSLGGVERFIADVHAPECRY